MRRITDRAPPRSTIRAASGLTFLWLVSVVGCGGPRGSSAPAGTAGLEMRAADAHPKLALVVRQGDPFAGIAVAVAHDFGGTASLWLGTIIERRLERVTTRPSALRPTGGGFVLSASAASIDEAARFVRAVSAALSTPLTEDDWSHAQAARQGGPFMRTWATAAEGAVAACDDEFGDRSTLPAPNIATLEHWRSLVYSTDSVAFGAVGPRSVLEEVASVLRETASWPSQGALKDPWPDADLSGPGPSTSGGESLSIGIRVARGDQALRAAAVLGDRRSALAVHVATLDRPWTVDRVVGTLRPRGACLRIDLSSSEQGAPDSRSAADVAALVLDDAERSMMETGAARGVLEQAVLSQTDPRDAAEIAAWHALSLQLPAGRPRALLSYGSSTRGASDSISDLPRLLSRARAARKEPSLETRSAAEPGQGEAWMLLGSPCATYRESDENAGVAALSVRAVASETPELDGVRIEPWVSSDGIGLLAHAPRFDASETASHQAARVAAALGRALAATPISDRATAAARARLAGELSSEMDTSWPVALEALAPKRPSLLDPRGTWQSVTEISTHAIDTARRTLIRGPLRLAEILGDAAPDAELEIERWLRPERAERSTCPPRPTTTSRPGQYVIPAPISTGAASRAILAVAIQPARDGGIPAEAEATAHLLNRPNGWLDTAVRVPGLAVFAEASVLGGSDGAALAIEVTTSERKAPDAIAQARALFLRLQEGAATADDLAQARVAEEAAALRASVDPRRRIVGLWTGRSDPKLPDLASLRRFHRQMLGAERHIVVIARPHP